MDTRRIVALFVAVVMVPLTACQASPSSSEPSIVGEENPASVVAPCRGGSSTPVTITMAVHAQDDASKPVNPIGVYKTLIRRFNETVGKKRGIRAELVDYPETAYENGLTRAIQSGRAPDVLEVDAPFLGRFAYDAFIQPLGNCVSPGKLASLLPSVVANGKYRGQEYTLGSYDSGMGLWASRKALAKVHARLPQGAADAWSVPEFDTILRTLQAEGYPTPLNIEWGYGAGEFRPFAFGPVLLSAGSGLFAPGYANSENVLNSPQSVWALTWFQEWAGEGLLDLATVPGANDRNFEEGRSAISWVGHWQGNAYKKALGNDLILLPLPNFGQGSKVFTGSWGFGMSKGTRNPDAAWALIDFLTDPYASKTLADSESAIPASRPVFSADPQYRPGGDRYLFAQDLNDPRVAVPRPQTPAYLVARDQFSIAFGDVISGRNVQNALDRAAARVQKDIAANGSYAGG
jgi:multiple sugar transport system substrate-binding protein